VPQQRYGRCRNFVRNFTIKAGMQGAAKRLPARALSDPAQQLTSASSIFFSRSLSHLTLPGQSGRHIHTTPLSSTVGRPSSRKSLCLCEEST
jgi:hypothetical protein